MSKLRNYSQLSVLMGLALMFLISCDDKGTTSTTTSNTSTATTDAQQFPKFDSFQNFSEIDESSEIDQLKVRLFNNPDDFNILNAMADLYFESGQYIEAMQTYDRALSVNPMCADCWNDKGLAFFYTGDAASALESFDKAIAIDPRFIHAWLSKGFVLTSEGRYQEAVEPLNKVKELDTTGRLTVAANKFLAQSHEGKLQ